MSVGTATVLVIFHSTCACSSLHTHEAVLCIILSHFAQDWHISDFWDSRDWWRQYGCVFQLDPAAYVDTCLYLYCSLPPKERDSAVCDTLASYARECAQQHVIIMWRTATLCGNELWWFGQQVALLIFLSRHMTFMVTHTHFHPLKGLYAFTVYLRM